MKRIVGWPWGCSCPWDEGGEFVVLPDVPEAHRLGCAWANPRHNPYATRGDTKKPRLRVELRKRRGQRVRKGQLAMVTR